jgi:hypothetical protein
MDGQAETAEDKPRPARVIAGLVGAGLEAHFRTILTMSEK